jgi:hypothetical protein
MAYDRDKSNPPQNRHNLLLAVVILFVGATQSQAQDWQQYPPDRELAQALCGGVDPSTTSLGNRAPIPLYRMMPGFLSDPANFARRDDDGDSQGSADGILVNVGQDNPFFDPRGPADPGGAGYYRLFSQMQLLDTGSTSVCFGLKAWTPAGVDNGGVAEGHTYFAPGLGVFQDLGNGTGLHGFVGQHFCADARSANRQGATEYGMAMHCPVPGLVEPTSNGVYVYVQALGRYGYTNYIDGREMEMDLVPGVHWRISDTLWMSLAASRRGMLTCSWQY